jgi:hypothetical protein
VLVTFEAAKILDIAKIKVIKKRRSEGDENSNSGGNINISPNNSRRLRPRKYVDYNDSKCDEDEYPDNSDVDHVFNRENFGHIECLISSIPSAGTGLFATRCF